MRLRHRLSKAQRAAATERTQQFRERRRGGWRFAGIYLHDDEISRLVARGLLHPEERTDTRAIEDALGVLLDRALSSAAGIPKAPKET